MSARFVEILSDAVFGLVVSVNVETAFTVDVDFNTELSIAKVTSPVAAVLLLPEFGPGGTTTGDTTVPPVPVVPPQFKFVAVTMQPLFKFATASN